MDLIGIYKTFHPNIAEHTFIFPIAEHGPFSQIEHPLTHKASLSKYRKLKQFMVLYIRKEQDYQSTTREAPEHTQTHGG